MDQSQVELSAYELFKQDNFLAAAVKNNSLVNIYLKSGIKLQGYINAFDNYVVFLTCSDKQKNTSMQMVYKQAIATILMNSKGWTGIK